MRQSSRLVFLLFIAIRHACSDSQPAICDRFYDYACSDWTRASYKPSYEPYWNRFTESAQHAYDLLEEVLRYSNAQQLTHVKSFYESCMRPADYMKQFQYLVKSIGGINFSSSRSSNYDYLIHVINVTKLLNIHPIIKFTATQSMLNIDRGDFVFPEILLHAEKADEELTVYRRFIERTFHLVNSGGRLEKERFIDNLLRRTPKINLGHLAHEIVEFERKLAKLPSEQLVTVEPIIMKPYEKQLLKLFNYTREAKVNIAYVEALEGLIASTQWHVISNYIVWFAIKDLLRDVNVGLRRVSAEVDYALIATLADVPRSHDCIGSIIKYIPCGDLLNEYFRTAKRDVEIDVDYVREMVQRIRRVLEEQLANNAWLSDGTKYKIIGHVQNIQIAILSSNMSVRISEFAASIGNNHFLNIVRLKSQQFKRIISQLFQKLDTQSINFEHKLVDVLDVNAYYSPMENAIVLPLGIMQPPFFSATQSPAANYGALGALIAHEFSHALDAILMNGNFNEQDIRLFFHRRDCIKTDYNLLAANQDSPPILNEYIADFVGVRLSYLAFRTVDSDKSQEFFMSFAQMWCELNNDSEKLLLALDEHPPVKIRVQGALTNWRSFRDTFGCTKSGKQECSLW